MGAPWRPACESDRTRRAGVVRRRRARALAACRSTSRSGPSGCATAGWCACSRRRPPRSCAGSSASSAPSERPGARPAACRPMRRSSPRPVSMSRVSSRSGSLAACPRRTRRPTSTATPLMERCIGGARPLRRHDDRRVERLDRDALQLDPRAARARGRPSQHRVLRALRLRHGAPRHDQRVLDGGLGGGLQHEPRDAAPRHRQVDRARPRQDPLDARRSSARRYRFLISGYPPFLKHLLDEGERRGFPWADYEIHGLVGGEGMTEELRDLSCSSASCRCTRATARPTSRSAWPASRR